MALQDHFEVRPRSTGEILDDGWRIYLGDLPLLLALNGLFILPAMAVALWLCAGPTPEAGWGRVLLPALAGLLFPLTGLGAGACQEAFHVRAEGRMPRLGRCLVTMGRRGLNHVTSQALMLGLPAVALLWFVIPDWHPLARWALGLASLALFFPLWLLGLGRHAALAAGQRNLWRSWRNSQRGSGRHPMRALIVVVSRIGFFLFAVLNLHLFLRFGLWAAEDLGGFNVALARVLCSPVNPVYLIGLLGFAWWLLAPYSEAVNYLFFVDDRTRYEGLDLWYRIEALFPIERPPADAANGLAAKPPESRTPALVPMLAVLALLALSPAVRADALGTVRQAQQDVARIKAEVRDAKPYPGGQRWVAPLRNIGARLEAEAGGRGGFTWYRQAMQRFAKLKQPTAVKELDRVEARLALIEESLIPPAGGPTRTRDEIKALVSPEVRPTRPKVKPAEDQPKPKPPPEDKKPAEQGEGHKHWQVGGGGPGLVGGASLGGVAHVFIIILVGLAVAAVVVGIVLLVLQGRKNRPEAPRRQEGAVGFETEETPEDLSSRDPADLWRQADDLARRGEFLPAVRALYLSVLVLLHQLGQIRYERTRTNGEYADQLRRQMALHGLFCRLTALFELKWYGERSCREDDYQTCRGLAEEVRQSAQPLAA